MFRWLILAILMAAVSISGAYRRRARVQAGTIRRSQEPGLLIAGRLAVALPLVTSILAYVVSPAAMSWASVPLPLWIRWTGALMGMLAIPLVWWVMRSLGRNVSETVLTKATHELVSTGPYRWVRHPLYSTGLILLLAMGLMSASWLTLGLVFIAAAAIRWVVIPREEEELIKKFGDRYRSYMSDTGRLFPRLGTR
jgi:protein-S-isoprenylcysteine O-methyltransferase Ste14